MELSMQYNEMTRDELRAECKARGVQGYSKFDKEGLVRLLDGHVTTEAVTAALQEVLVEEVAEEIAVACALGAPVVEQVKSEQGKNEAAEMLRIAFEGSNVEPPGVATPIRADWKHFGEVPEEKAARQVRNRAKARRRALRASL